MPYTTHVESGKGNSLIFVGGVRERRFWAAPSTSRLDREMRMTSLTLRCLVPLIVFALIVGCARHSEQSAPWSATRTPAEASPALSNLAKKISGALPTDSNPLHLSVEAVTVADEVRLHCSLTNVSSKPLQMNRLSLPCAGWWSLGVIGLTTDGRVLLQSVP